MTDSQLFDKVLFSGADLKGKGGISSVIASYSEAVPGFHYIPSNSRRGTLAGAVNLGLLLLRLPFERMLGRRLLHLHGCSGKSWIRKKIIMTWGRILGFKTIFHCHGGEIKEYFNRIGLPRAKRVLDKYDAIIVLSEYWQEYFEKELGYADKTLKVNNIVRHHAPSGKKGGSATTTGELSLLFLGRLGHGKGIFDILDAIESHNLHGFRLKVGGDGEVERFKAEVERRGLADRVEYVGWVTGDAKDKLLDECDALMLPSYNEGLPISILEAMAAGKAVITSPVGGIPEVITDGENGLIVSPGDTAGIARAISAYISDPELARRHGAASLQRVEPFYPEAVVARLTEIYRKILTEQ